MFTQPTTWFQWWDLFLCLQIAFCSFVATWQTLLADIQRTNCKSTQGIHLVNKQLFNRCPLYSFTLMIEYYLNFQWSINVLEHSQSCLILK